MNGDLISREALKKALKSNCDVCHDKNTNWCENCCPHNDFEDLIDNASAVDLDDFYGKAFRNGEENALKIRGLEERPQGEWNEIQAGMFVCPFCGARPHKDFKNFCANCGADMRGGKE